MVFDANVMDQLYHAFSPTVRSSNFSESSSLSEGHAKQNIKFNGFYLHDGIHVLSFVS